MNTEVATNRIETLMGRPTMSDYLLKALLEGEATNHLRVNGVTNVASKIDPVAIYTNIAIKCNHAEGYMRHDLLVFNSDRLAPSDESGHSIYSHNYGALPENLEGDWLPSGRDHLVSNYRPAEDVWSERSQCFLEERPDEASYEVACLLLKLAGLDKTHLSMVYLDSIGLRHALLLDNENDNDPELTVVVIDRPFRLKVAGQLTHRPADYRKKIFGNRSLLAQILLRELRLNGESDVMDDHPLDTDEEKTEWADVGPYQIRYNETAMFVYTEEDEGMLPVEPLMRVTNKVGPFNSSGYRTPGWVLRDAQQIRHLLENQSALYQPHPASELARDFLAVMMKRGGYDHIDVYITLNLADNQPATITLVQGDLEILFNLQY